MRRRGLVAGAAIASHRQNEQQEQYQQQAQYDQQAAYQQGQADAQAAAAQQAAAAPPPPPADPMDAKFAELQKLGQLHDSGILTDEEFAAQKQQILAS